MIVVRKTTKTKSKVIVKTRFVSSFMLKMLLNSDLMKGGAPSLGSEVLTKSSRPPF